MSGNKTSNTAYGVESDPHEAAGGHSSTPGKEAASMNRCKVLLYVALFITALGAGAITFFHMTDQEESSFDSEFMGISNLIFQVVDKRAVSKYAAIAEVATVLEVNIRLRNVSWPYYTIKDLDASSNVGLVTADNDLVFIAPIVNSSNVSGWNEYVNQEESWIKKDLSDANVFSDPGRIPPIHGMSMGSNQTIHVPLWEMTPAPMNSSILNFDLFSLDWFRPMAMSLMLNNKIAESPIVDVDFLLQDLVNNSLKHYDLKEPRSLLLHPFFSDFYNRASTANEVQVARGFVGVVVPWGSYFTKLLPVNTNGIIVDVNSTCGSHFTYVINGYKAQYVKGNGKAHQKYTNMGHVYQLPSKSTTFSENVEKQNTTGGDCLYTLTVYPSEEFHDSFTTSKPLFYALLVVAVFWVTGLVFLYYDLAVQRKQRQIMATAEETTVLQSKHQPIDTNHQPMKEYHGTGNDSKGMLGSKPNADLFPAATIMFADLVGFTAWSSMREPPHVFTLLETIFHEFDLLADRCGIFKVETVGDCYVAASGLPDQRKDHAVAMARFAYDCVKVFGDVVTKLEVSLGPDTTDLGVRVGIHSGPVTAGVLRGGNSRFQLFGDTVNTTARIETTGAKNKIHVSQETADLLEQAGKSLWLVPRKDKIQSNGNGEMSTFWLELRNDLESSSTCSTSNSSESSNQEEMLATIKTQYDKMAPSQKELDDKQTRLVNWNADVLTRLLKCIVAQRNALGCKNEHEVRINILEKNKPAGSIVIDEVQDFILLPPFDPEVAKRQSDPDSIELDDRVMIQLHAYVRAISLLYRDNAFHNFEHASHVSMSVSKLLGLIIAPNEVEVDDDASSDKTIHDHTFGITSDPLTTFACVFAALIHDVDHCGVPNSQLMKENITLAATYRNKSVAEQHSLDVAWNIFMDNSYRELRRTIYANGFEYRRFRQLVVNSVMATDIMDNDLSAARNARWAKAFAEQEGISEVARKDNIKRKATIMIEHLMQASDDAHTMQHWHVYRKWNEKLFLEMYKAYKDGRSDTDPSENWYEREIGFFDNCIIPLAKKLKDSGVFGMSSDEYLYYAESNRQEWERKGKEIVQQMMEFARR